MRILQVCQWYIPEYGFQEYFLADAWQRMGHEVLSVAGTQVYPNGGYGEIEGQVRQRKVAPGLHQERGTDVYRLPCFELWHRTILSPKLESVVREFEPDIVLTHGVTSPNALRISRLKRRSQKPFRLICDDHLISEIVHDRLRDKIFYAVFRRIVTPALLRSVDVFAPISEETRQIINERCRIPSEMMTVVPLGVDVHRFRRDEAKREAIRDELGVGQDEVVVVFAGKLIPRKGIARLIDAALHVLNAQANTRLLVIGSGEEAFVRPHMQRLQKAGFESRVTWLPLMPNKELPGYFSAADVGVWPQEPSMVILEAAACGVPIICKDSPYHRERFADGAAHLFDSYDEMLDSIIRLVSDRELRESAGALARGAVAKYSWDRVAASFLEV